MSVILAFIIAFETTFRQHSVHETVSPLRNRFFSVTESRTLGFRRRQYGRLLLAIAGLLVRNSPTGQTPRRIFLRTMAQTTQSRAKVCFLKVKN